MLSAHGLASSLCALTALDPLFSQSKAPPSLSAATFSVRNLCTGCSFCSVGIHIIDLTRVRITKGTYTEAHLRGSSGEEGRPTLHVDSIMGWGPGLNERKAG